MPRSDVSRQTSLAQQSVHRLLEGLRAERFIALGEADIRGRGKPSPSVLIDGSRFASVGLALTSQFPRYALVDLSGQVLDSGEIDAPPGDKAAVLAALDRHIADWRAAGRQELIGLGLALEALREGPETFTAAAPLADWSRKALRQILTERYDLPVYTERSAGAAAMAEYYLGKARDFGCFAYLAFNQSFDCGLVYSRQVFAGQSGNAADVAQLFGKVGAHPTPALACLLEHYRRSGAAAELADLGSKPPEADPILNHWLTQLRPELQLATRALRAVVDVGAIYIGGDAPLALRQHLAAVASSGLCLSDAPGPQIMASEIVGDAAHLGAALLPLHARVYSPPVFACAD